MPASRPAHWSSSHVRISLLCGSLLVTALVLAGREAGRAEPVALSPQAAAVIPAQGKLHVTVDLAKTVRPAAGRLRVELLGPKGDVLTWANAEPDKGRLAHYRCEVTAPRVETDRLTLRCRLGRQAFTVPVRQVLLARAHETTLSAGQDFHAGSTTAVRCGVQSVKSITETRPLSGAEVRLTLRPAEGTGKSWPLFAGKTGPDGSAEARFAVPAVPSGKYTLEVATRSALGEEVLRRAVHVKADPRILLVTDKPLYQPGQMIRIRALALRPFDLKPAGEANLVFEVEDPKGNKVFKRPARTSAHGIAAVDFQLADEVNQGDYHVRAVLGDVRAEKTVAVKPYVLPRFKVRVGADRNFYLPQETVKGTVQADYFFGKPVAGGTVKVTASTFDVAFKAFQTWQGKTDANGHAKFEIKLPEYFVGLPLAQGNALVKLDVQVTDTADHAETVARTFPVSDQPIRVSLIPEGGRLLPGLENRVYAATLYPDGTPAACTIKVWAGRQAQGEPVAEVKTDAGGLAEFAFTPGAASFRQAGVSWRNQETLGGVVRTRAPQTVCDLCANAQDARGNTGRAVHALGSEPAGANLLLRLDQAVYQGGDTLRADLRTTAATPAVYLDVVKDGQTMLTRWLTVKDGKAAYRLDLPAELFGTVEVHAYQVTGTGVIVRDSRVVYVQPKNDLTITVTADRAVYKPGTNGTIRFQVTDAAGKPTPAALGVIVVDEAVYALQEMQPGLEKVFFTLQEELLKPQVQVNYKPGEDFGELVRRRRLPPRKQRAARVLLAAVRPRLPARWTVAPQLERRRQIERRLGTIGWALFDYATQGTKPREFQAFDFRAWHTHFRPGLLEDVVRAGLLSRSLLDNEMGGTLTADDLTRLEKSFTADRLARAVNAVRMNRLANALAKVARAHRKEWLKDGRWQLPATALAEAARRELRDPGWAIDVWGTAYRLVPTGGKPARPELSSPFASYRLVCAGPDRKFGTDDDVVCEAPKTAVTAETKAWWDNGPNRYRSVGRTPRARAGSVGKLAKGRSGAGRASGRAGGTTRSGSTSGARHSARPLSKPNKASAKAPLAKNRPRPADSGETRAPAAPALAEAPRVREYFPETLRWEPAIITDAQGRAALCVTFADSITTWRLSASASSKDGALGGVSAPLRVFQDFFVDLDLPVRLTQNDEVAFPVAVYNYLKEPQEVKLELRQEPWFELADAAGLTRTLNLKANEVRSVKFRIRARRIGPQPLQVTATGPQGGDAIKRVIEVVPDGKRIEQVITDRLTGPVTQSFDIPAHALPDASGLVVKLYPGVMSQVLEGAEGLLRLPGG